jgi:hypothetical protein
VLIILSSWGSQLAGYLPASSTFSGAVAGEKKKISTRRVSYAQSFTLFLVLLYFILLASFYQKHTQK